MRIGERWGANPPSRHTVPVNKLTATVGLLVALAIIVVSSPPFVGKEQPSADELSVTVVTANERKDAPNLAGADLNGHRLSISDFEGQVLVVNVWGPWCAPCRDEAPVLKQVADQYASQNVQFIGILNQSGSAEARAFNSSAGITYPSFADQDGALERSFTKSLPTTAIPTTWVLDSQGRVAARIIDQDLSKSTLSDVIDDVISGP